MADVFLLYYLIRGNIALNKKVTPLVGGIKCLISHLNHLSHLFIRFVQTADSFRRRNEVNGPFLNVPLNRRLSLFYFKTDLYGKKPPLCVTTFCLTSLVT